MNTPRSFVASLAFALVLPAVAAAQTNPIAHEPVLLYQVTGGTIAGSTHQMVTVYTDGQVTRTILDAAHPQGLVEVRTASLDRVRKLSRDLTRLGAASLRDGSARPVPDLPLTSVTVFLVDRLSRPTTNTFSFYEPGRGRGEVESAILSFLEDVF